MPRISGPRTGSAGRVLLAAIIVIELSIVAITVLINQWNARFYNALQDKNWDVFVSELLFFCVLAAIFIVLAVYQLYLNQWLQIRWRRWMTQQLSRRLARQTPIITACSCSATRPTTPTSASPRTSTSSSRTDSVLGLGLLNSLVTLVSFVAILWGLSASAPFTLFGIDWAIPGYLVWAALIYSILGTALTHWIGRALIGLNFMQQRYEADFRFNLVRVRENSEQIALLDGEPAERQRLLDRFGRVIGNWMLIMSRTKRLTFFTAGLLADLDRVSLCRGQPGLFRRHDPARRADADRIRLRQRAELAVVLRQSTIYRQLAEWRAVIERLTASSARSDAARACGASTRRWSRCSLRAADGRSSSTSSR